MGIPEGYHKSSMKGLGMEYTDYGYSLHFNLENLGGRIDLAQDALDAQVWNDVRNYMPFDTGNMQQQTSILNASVRGEVYMYPPELSYGHYQYMGEKYVDPVYGIGGFYNDRYGFWSRPDVVKVPSGEPLVYKRPGAESRWGEAAFRDHAQEWLAVVKRVIGG